MRKEFKKIMKGVRIIFVVLATFTLVTTTISWITNDIVPIIIAALTDIILSFVTVIGVCEKLQENTTKNDGIY